MIRRNRLVIMVKEPRPGRVKTRLAKDIGSVRAAWWFRHNALRVMRRLRDPRWELILAVTPDSDGLVSRVWPGDLRRIKQGKGDLGQRMRRVIRAAPPGPCLIIGADIPDVSKSHIFKGFEALNRYGATIGPATDGGFWAIGLKRTGTPVPPGLFRNVRWSSPFALEDTLASVETIFAKLDELGDVDMVCDLFAY